MVTPGGSTLPAIVAEAHLNNLEACFTPENHTGVLPSPISVVGFASE